MLKKTEAILFTTNLSDISRSAFNHAALLAAQLNANIVLLHVVEKLPETYESRARSLFGEHQWEAVVTQHRKEAEEILVGKMSSRQIIRAALEQFCRDSGIDSDQCGNISVSIVIKQGDVVETILQEAEVQRCDLIAMGASKGLMAGATVGAHIKSVLKKAKVPVLVIPPIIDA